MTPEELAARKALNKRRRRYQDRHDPWRVAGFPEPPRHYPTLPVEPLVELLDHNRVSIGHITGLDRGEFYRAIKRGHISLWAADHICTQLDRHVDEVYPTQEQAS